jgi:RND family efflux transporter MFP subunit
MKRHVAGSVLWVPWILLSLSLVGCSETPEARGDAESIDENIPLVEALQARHGYLPLEERLSGIVRAQNQVTIRPEIEAPIVEVFVRSGERVEKDQPLVRLQDRVLQEQLRQAEAAVRLADAAAAEAHARVDELAAQTARTKQLSQQGLVSDLDVEMQSARLEAARAVALQEEARGDQARATVEERQSAIDKTLVRAPVTGRVGRRNAEVGMLSDPNTALFVVGNLDVLTIEIPLTESMLAFIEEGQAVRLTAPVLGDEPVMATLSRISPFLAEGSFSTVGEIDVQNPEDRLRPGMFVTVDVLYGRSEEATLVPTTVVWEDPRTSRRGVFVVEFPDGLRPDRNDPESTDQARNVSFRPVEIVAEGRGRSGVRHLDPGEWVVTMGQHLLRTDEVARARIRPTTWEHVLGLQSLQREDLLRQYLEEQQRWARERGALPPSNDEFMGGELQSRSDAAPGDPAGK